MVVFHANIYGPLNKYIIVTVRTIFVLLNKIVNYIWRNPVSTYAVKVLH